MTQLKWRKFQKSVCLSLNLFPVGLLVGVLVSASGSLSVGEGHALLFSQLKKTGFSIHYILVFGCAFCLLGMFTSGALEPSTLAWSEGWPNWTLSAAWFCLGQQQQQ